MPGGIASIALLETMLGLIVKAALLMALSLVAVRLLKKVSASTRYFLLCSTVIVVAASPLLFSLIPESQLPMPAVIQSCLPTNPTPHTATFEPTGGATANIHTVSQVTQVKQTAAVSSNSQGTLLYLWFLGTCVALGRVFVGFAGSARHVRASRVMTQVAAVDIVVTATDTLGLRRNPEVRISSRTIAPFVSGIFRPVVVLPGDAMGWPKDRLRHVILHEFAHIKRNDHITWPLMNLAASWLWFVPFLWMALAQSRREKERACDDYVISCEDGVEYARHLLQAYASMRNTAWPVSVSLLGMRGSEVKERIAYMLRNGIDRKPISRYQTTVLLGLILGLTIPLLSVTGLSSQVPAGDVTPGERNAVVSTLRNFYAALSYGEDFQAVDEQFLTTDYFDDPSLTLENLDEAVWMPVFDNTLYGITEGSSGVVQKVRSRIASLHREGQELVASVQIDVTGCCMDKGHVYLDEDSSVVFVSDKSTGTKTALKECPVVNSLSQQIRFRFEDNAWKISKFNDGLAIMRMDTNNPYGPIFLVWIESIDEATTPYGARVFKVIPHDIVPDAHNTEFVLEE